MTATSSLRDYRWLIWGASEGGSKNKVWVIWSEEEEGERAQPLTTSDREV